MKKFKECEVNVFLEHALKDAKRIKGGSYRPIGSMPNAICFEHHGIFAVGFAGHPRNIFSWDLESSKEEIVVDLIARGLGGIFEPFVHLESQNMSIQGLPKEFIISFKGNGRKITSCHGEKLETFHLLLTAEAEGSPRRGSIIVFPDGRRFKIVGCEGCPTSASSMYFEEVF